MIAVNDACSAGSLMRQTRCLSKKTRQAICCSVRPSSVNLITRNTQIYTINIAELEENFV